MQTDGNLVSYTAAGTAVWSTNTAGNPGAYLVLHDDGNMVIYKGDKSVWESGTASEGGNILAAGQSLLSASNGRITSRNGNFSLIQQKGERRRKA